MGLHTGKSRINFICRFVFSCAAAICFQYFSQRNVAVRRAHFLEVQSVFYSSSLFYGILNHVRKSRHRLGTISSLCIMFGFEKVKIEYVEKSNVVVRKAHFLEIESVFYSSNFFCRYSQLFRRNS